MAGLFKMVIGIAIGAGVGYALAKRASTDVETGSTYGVASDVPPTGIKARLQDAAHAGQTARAAREAQLQERFRQRVHDPQAFTAQDPSGAP
ncbi:MAG: hypothetical protein DCC58_09555 [Chloroflexi bacterium]|nr:MAG: hypothetical protein DCC58_09555 [Chloroflexota bacterium]